MVTSGNCGSKRFYFKTTCTLKQFMMLSLPDADSGGISYQRSVIVKVLCMILKTFDIHLFNAIRSGLKFNQWIDYLIIQVNNVGVFPMHQWGIQLVDWISRNIGI